MPVIKQIQVNGTNYDLEAKTASSMYEANLLWGGKNFSSSYGCIDAAMVSELGANRIAGAKPAGVFVEYSTDNGSTWTDYGVSDAKKRGMTLGGTNSLGAYLGKHTTAGSNTTSDQLRVRILTSAASIYTVLNKFVIYMSTNGDTINCTIRARLENNRLNNTETWVTFADQVPVSGWSGYNVINTSGLTTYGNSPASQYGEIQFIFKCTAVNTNYPAACIHNIFGFGGVGWTTPTTMAKTGHLYSYNSNMDASFPAQVTATQFNGPLNGNASTATKLQNARSVQVNLATTTAASFDGSANIAPGVTGTLPIANGGTGQTTAANAINNLLKAVTDSGQSVTGGDKVLVYNGGNTNPTWKQLNFYNIP